MPRHRFVNTRERIEEAATRLFVLKGITDTSVRDITREVGISEGALYRHFESKEDLVWQTFEQNYTAFALELNALAARESTARQKVGAMIRGFCRAHDDNPTVFNFLVFVQHGQLSKLEPKTRNPHRDAVGARARH
jgi:AcrR family transcriptional regulator